jgi:hypothetical protein
LSCVTCIFVFVFVFVVLRTRAVQACHHALFLAVVFFSRAPRCGCACLHLVAAFLDYAVSLLCLRAVHVASIDVLVDGLRHAHEDMHLI